MDVAMSIASSMAEMPGPNAGRFPAKRPVPRRHACGPGYDGHRFSNTLILAFAGGSISMLVLNYAYDLPWLQIINSNNIGIAIMQGLSGSFGVVLCVPATVALSTLLYTLPGRTKESASKQPLGPT